MKERVKNLLKELISKECSQITEEKKEGKILFFCGSYLMGSITNITEGLTAVSFYSKSVKDPLIYKFLEKMEKEFGSYIIEKGTKISSGVEDNFYYTYVHLKA